MEVGGNESLMTKPNVRSFTKALNDVFRAMARNASSPRTQNLPAMKRSLSVVVLLCWPVMSLAGFASRMAVSRELKSVLPDLYSASLVPITIGDNEVVTEATNPTTVQQVVMQQDKDVSLAFVVRRPG